MFDACNRSVSGREYEGETQRIEKGKARLNRTLVLKREIGTKTRMFLNSIRVFWMMMKIFSLFFSFLDETLLEGTEVEMRLILTASYFNLQPNE